MREQTILIVEDEAIVAADLARNVAQLGYEVAGPTATGADAVSLALRVNPALVLMDIRLRGAMDGVEAAERIRRERDIPVVFLTAHSDEATFSRAKITGPLGYVLKPFEQRDLAIQIEMALYRDRAEREINVQREWLRVTLTSIGDAVIATDADGRISFINPAAESLTGWTSDHALQQPIPSVFQVVHEHTGDPVTQPVSLVLSTRQAAELEDHAVLVHRHGHTIPIEDSAAPIIAADGQMTGAVLVFQDVTEKRRAEEALRRSEQQYRLLFSANPNPMFVFDEETLRFLAVNDAAVNHYGWSREEFLAMTVLDIRPVDDQPRILEVIRANMSARERDIGVHRHVLKNGALVYMEIRISSIDFAGRPGRLCSLTDVTERTRAHEALRQSEARLRTLLDAAPEAILVHGRGVFQYANQAMARLLGAMRPEDLLGQSLLDRIVPESRAYVLEQLGRHTEPTGRPALAELDLVRLDDTRVPVEATAVDISFQDTPATLVFARDISERRRVQSEKARLESQLLQAQKMESIGRLAGGVAHDFNNILAAMMMNLSLFGESHDAPDDQEFVTELLRDTERAADLTRQLLMFSRRSLLEMRVLDASDVIEQLLKLVGRVIGEHIRLRFDRGPGAHLVEADPGMLEQVFVNLAVNARDAMPHGGALTLVTGVSAFAEGDLVAHPLGRPGTFVRMDVIDTGTGMDDATLSQIFEPFFTTKAAGQGTGLGLATAHGIVAQHKGWIEVESRPGEGSRFSVFLPAAAQPVTSVVPEPARRPSPGHETILYIEDDEAVRRTTSASLRKLGYTVLEAGTGQRGLTLWQQHKAGIALLLTDMVMPEGMTGLDLAERLRAERPDLKVIIYSGYSVELLDSARLSKSDIVYIPKPFGVTLLSQRIRQSLD